VSAFVLTFSKSAIRHVGLQSASAAVLLGLLLSVDSPENRSSSLYLFSPISNSRLSMASQFTPNSGSFLNHLEYTSCVRSHRNQLYRLIRSHWNAYHFFSFICLWLTPACHPSIWCLPDQHTCSYHKLSYLLSENSCSSCPWASQHCKNSQFSNFQILWNVFGLYETVQFETSRARYLSPSSC